MQAFLLVGLGGAIGAVARYGTGVLVGRLGFSGYPWATMIANITGSFAMGLLIGWLALATPGNQNELRLFVAVGILGAFTTFSTFSLDVVTLVERGQVFGAVGYLFISVVASILALAFGLLFMRNFA